MGSRAMQTLIVGLVLVAMAACSSSSGGGGGGGGGGTGDNTGGGTGSVSGVVVDAATSTFLANVLVALLSGSPNTLTDSTGQFTLTGVPAGNQTLTFTLTGFTLYNMTVTVVAGQTLDLGEVPAVTPISGNERRFVLTWGATPEDLDLYGVTPAGDVAFYGNQNPLGDHSIFLDVDDTTSFGPETLTINGYQTGTYHLLVNDFSNGFGDPAGVDTGSPSQLGTSSAVVQEYTAAGLVNTYPVPNCGGTDYWWNVLTLATDTTGPGTVTLVNTCVQDVSAITGAAGTFSTLRPLSKSGSGRRK